MGRLLLRVKAALLTPFSEIRGETLGHASFSVEMYCHAVIFTVKASNEEFTFIYQEVIRFQPNIHAGLRLKVGRFYDQGIGRENTL